MLIKAVRTFLAVFQRRIANLTNMTRGPTMKNAKSTIIIGSTSDPACDLSQITKSSENSYNTRLEQLYKCKQGKKVSLLASRWFLHCPSPSFTGAFSQWIPSPYLYQHNKAHKNHMLEERRDSLR